MPDNGQPGNPKRVFFQDRESGEWRHLTEIAHKVQLLANVSFLYELTVLKCFIHCIVIKWQLVDAVCVTATLMCIHSMPPMSSITICMYVCMYVP